MRDTHDHHTPRGEQARLTLVMATHNAHKVQEIRSKLRAAQLDIEVLSLDDLGDHEEIVEDGTTLEANALIKAKTAYRRHHTNCFADDTGLEVDALDGRPGVYTARYAGEHATPADNRAKMLQELQGVHDRAATFRTVIALVWEGVTHIFTGEVAGTITTEEVGNEGFGYDPIFCPTGYDCTFAEMGEEVKNAISHRGRAVEAMVDFLCQACSAEH